MNAIVPHNMGQVSRVFANAAVQDDLSAGVQAGFGLIGYKGKVWSIRHRGEERQLLREDGDGARNSIEVVILKSATCLSKIFYAEGYTEGNTAAPDCFSTNGITPDASVQKKQSPVCASCPQNAWGSRVSNVTGKAGKACSDSKRLAVVPLQDISNEVFGGPLLLRVPAASLHDMATFGSVMSKQGYPYYAIGTRISFDTAEAFPKFQFSAIRQLTDVEAASVMELRESPAVARILAEASEFAPPVAAPAQVAQLFEQPPVPQQVIPQVQPQVQTWTPAPQSQTPPSTGVVSSQPVQPVAQPVVTPVMAAPPAPQVGVAVTASPSGFGPMAPLQGGTQSTGAQPQKDTQPPTPQGTLPPATSFAFEQSLDDLLNKILPNG